MHLIGILAVAVSQSSSEAIWAALDQQSQKFHDASFAFEGEYADIDARGNWTKDLRDFVGRGGWHQDGVVLVEQHRQDERGITRYSRSLERNGTWTERIFGPSKSSPPSTQVQRKSGIGELLSRPQTWFYLWPTAALTTAPRNDRDLFKYIGTADADGLSCHVLEIAGNKGSSFTWKLWLAPDRGWNAVRMEEWMSGLLAFSTSQYEFFQRGDRWIPAKCVRLRHIRASTPGESELKSAPNPTLKINYRLVTSTLEIGRGFGPEEFKVEVDRRFNVFGPESMVSNAKPPPQGRPRGKSIDAVDDVAMAREAEAKILNHGTGVAQPSGEFPYLWLVAIGLVLLAVGGFLRWRQGRVK